MAEQYSVERAFIAWLNESGYSASFSVPTGAPDNFCTVARVSGGIENRMDRPTVAVDVWAKSAEAASDAAVAIRNLVVLEGSTPDGVKSVWDVSGPLYTPDPESRRPCYEVQFTCTTRL